MALWCPETLCVHPPQCNSCVYHTAEELEGKREHNSQINLITNDFKMGPSLLSAGEVVSLREATQICRGLGRIHPRNSGWRGGAQAVT